MAEPTKAELMSMIIRLDNKLNALLKVNGVPDRLPLFDKLPDQPKDFFSNEIDQIPAPCNKNLSVWYCRNQCPTPCKQIIFQHPANKSFHNLESR